MASPDIPKCLLGMQVSWLCSQSMLFAVEVELITCVSGTCRLATQVALLGNVPEPFDSVKGLVKWQEAHRRKLLQSEHMVHSIASFLMCHTAFAQLYDFHGSYNIQSFNHSYCTCRCIHRTLLCLLSCAYDFRCL